MSDKKKAPFWIFVMDKMKKLEIEDGQQGAVGGERDVQAVVAMVSPEWQNMTPKDREPYVQRAKKGNDARKAKGSNDGSNLPGMMTLVRQNAEARTRKMAADLTKIFSEYADHGNLAGMPIVICKFNTYYWNKSAKDGTRVLPSEVSFSAWSIKQGVFANFSTLIDPGADHDGKKSFRVSDEVKASCDKQHILMCDFSTELQDCKRILNSINSFMEMTIGRKVLFCRREDIDVTEACLEWLCQCAGLDRSDFEVLNVNALMKMLSIKAYSDKNCDEAKTNAEGKLDAMACRELSNAKARMTAAWDMKNKTVGGLVVYPNQHPFIAKRGLFLEEDHVDALLSKSNYSYYEQLACPYHFELIDGSEFCSLNIANRYAFMLLDALLPNFDTIPQAGFHYPRMKDLKTEVILRRKMLLKWNDCQYESYASSFLVVEKEQRLKKEQAMEFEKAMLMKAMEADKI